MFVQLATAEASAVYSVTVQAVGAGCVVPFPQAETAIGRAEATVEDRIFADWRVRD